MLLLYNSWFSLQAPSHGIPQELAESRHSMLLYKSISPKAEVGQRTVDWYLPGSACKATGGFPGVSSSS